MVLPKIGDRLPNGQIFDRGHIQASAFIQNIEFLVRTYPAGDAPARQLHVPGVRIAYFARLVEIRAASVAASALPSTEIKT